MNGEEVNFGDSQQNGFNNVTITDLGNQTMSAVFTSGPYVEVKVQNKIISVVVVSLPVSMQEKTKGLMGNYNGNISDDLDPNSNASPLPLSASLQDIHEKFGITCKSSVHTIPHHTSHKYCKYNVYLLTCCGWPVTQSYLCIFNGMFLYDMLYGIGFHHATKEFIEYAYFHLHAYGDDTCYCYRDHQFVQQQSVYL